MVNLQKSVQDALIESTQQSIASLNLTQKISQQKLQTTLVLLGLVPSSNINTMCTDPGKRQLRDELNSLNSSEKEAMRGLFDDLMTRMQGKMALVYSQVFANNLDVINSLKASDPDAMSSLSPIIANFFEYATRPRTN